MGTAHKDFVAAIAAMKNPGKNKAVNVPGKYKFEYADLSAILDDVRSVFGAHRLALVQPVDASAGELVVSTLVIHEDGTIVSSSRMSAQQPGQPQLLGSLITYLRRYAIASLVGIAADDDDDGVAATTETQAPKRSKTPPADAAAPPITQADLDALMAHGLTLDRAGELCASLGRRPPAALSADARKALYTWLGTPAGKAAAAKHQRQPGEDND